MVFVRGCAIACMSPFSPAAFSAENLRVVYPPRDGLRAWLRACMYVSDFTGRNFKKLAKEKLRFRVPSARWTACVQPQQICTKTQDTLLVTKTRWLPC